MGAQDRDQYEKVDVEYYFNYMGCLAVEGTYDRMYKLVDGARTLLRRASCCAHASAAGLHPIDIILLFAAAEADLPKIEEARATARYLALLRAMTHRFRTADLRGGRGLEREGLGGEHAAGALCSALAPVQERLR